MGWFSGIENAKSSEKLPFIREGQYVLEVQNLKAFNARSKGGMFVAEYKVLEATGAKANEVGSQCSHVIKLTLESALGNIKGLASAILNEPEKNITEKVTNELAPENNEVTPARGVKLRAEAYVIQTKKGTDFTLVKYSPYDVPKADAKKAA